MTAADWITLVIAVATIGSLLFAAYNLRATTQANKTLKRADVAMHCTIRYEELKTLASGLEQRFRDQPSKPNIPEAQLEETEKLRDLLWRNYYSRYWALKSDQFDFWLYGLVEHGTFLDWTFSTALAHWKEDPNRPLRPTCPFSFHDSWKKWKSMDHGPVNPQFVRFTDQLFLTVERDSQTGPQPFGVLGVIKRFHGSPSSPGVSRRLQKLAFKGVSLEELERILLDASTQGPLS
jgi:hypothetical protein